MAKLQFKRNSDEQKSNFFYKFFTKPNKYQDLKLDPGSDSRHGHAREDNDNDWYAEVRKEAKPPNLLVDAIAILMIF